jgi:hypothetical protein
VGCVGLDLAQWNPPPWRWQASVAPGPHPIGAAKVGNAGVGADACAREGDNALGLNDPSNDGLDLLFEALFPGHGTCREATGSCEDGVSGNLAEAHAVLGTRYAAERQKGHITHVAASTTTTCLTA